MKVIFAGSPGIAVPSLLELSEMECSGEDIELAGLLTNPDSSQGRSSVPLATEVSIAAARLSNLRQQQGFPPILQLKYEKLDKKAREEIAAMGFDLLISFAYGRIFGQKFLSIFPKGGINIHPSLLPRYRGPSPIPAAILARDMETGITIQKLALKIDTGDILAQETISIDPKETSASLSEKVSCKAAEMLRSFMLRFLAGPVQAVAQQGEPVYCSLIDKEQGIINWDLSALEIDAQVRAYTPWPLCYTRWKGEDLYILEGCVNQKSGDIFPGFTNRQTGTVLGIDMEHGIQIQTGDGIYLVSRLQRQAKKALDWKAFLNGARDFVGSRLLSAR